MAWCARVLECSTNVGFAAKGLAIGGQHYSWNHACAMPSILRPQGACLRERLAAALDGNVQAALKLSVNPSCITNQTWFMTMCLCWHITAVILTHWRCCYTAHVSANRLRLSLLCRGMDKGCF